MNGSDFVIIGGVAAGPKTAATLARRLPSARITLFQKEALLSYATCGLPYYASGEMADIKELTRTPYGVVRDTAFFRGSKGFEAVTGAEVINIDRKSKSVTVRKVAGGESFEHTYQKLVITTGAVPKKPSFPFPESPLVSPFTRPKDAVEFRSLAEQGKVGEVVIIGAGFIGCELVDAVRDMWGIDATLIEQGDHLLPHQLDPEMAAIVQRFLESKGIKIITGAEVEGINVGDDGRPVVSVKDQPSIVTDYVFYCLGVSPQTKLARECGLDIGETGGILVNRQLCTSDPDIYAGGDCIESFHQITDHKLFYPMGSLANRHGRIIAENLAGGKEEFSGVLGSFMLSLLGLNIGSVGLSARTAREHGFQVKAVWGTFPDKPDYRSDKDTFVLKLIYDETGNRLLGLQGIGGGDVCRRVDVFSSFLQNRGTTDDLVDFEHGYAPQFSEPLDPLFQMATIARLQQQGVSFIDPGTDFSNLSDPFLLLDVRETEEASTKGIPSVIAQAAHQVVNIPLNELSGRLGEIEKGRKVIVVCQRGSRSYQAAILLKQSGIEDIHIVGGGLSSLT